MAVDQTTITQLEGTPVQYEGGLARPAQSYWSESWERLRGSHFGMFFGGVLVVLAVIAITAPLFSAFVTHLAPTSVNLNDSFAPFSRAHPLGTDELGRDTLTRLVYGARVSLGVGFLTVAIYLLIGGSVGISAGFYGGWWDDLLMRFVDILLAIPTIYLLIMITSMLPLPIGPIIIRHDAFSLSTIIAITVWGTVARLVRGEVLTVKNRDFILATRSIGASNLRLMLRHLLPNVLPVMIVAASLGVGQIILLEAALDFIGLGVQPPTASWGNMLLNAQSYFYHSTSLVILPGICIVLAVLSANIFGNAVRDAFDPRLK
ncbi:MAG: ABC transporter permease [Chloroflexi bacterium]|nr:MAG: ABC transporter permease [Chloroflexota bacterium]